MKKMTPRKVYETTRQSYFGWDLRDTDWERIVWHRSPRLSQEEIVNWPYRFESGSDMTPDFQITVQGDPGDDLLTSWVEEEEKQMALTCVA